MDSTRVTRYNHFELVIKALSWNLLLGFAGRDLLSDGVLQAAPVIVGSFSNPCACVRLQTEMLA